MSIPQSIKAIIAQINSINGNLLEYFFITGSRSTADMSDSFVLRIGAVHRLNPDWLSTYVDYSLAIDVFHGSLRLGRINTAYITPSKNDNNLFFTSLVFDSWENFDHLPLCILPRECRLVFTLRGRRKPQDEKNEALEVVELGWASIQCFNFKGYTSHSYRPIYQLHIMHGIIMTFHD